MMPNPHGAISRRTYSPEGILIKLLSASPWRMGDIHGRPSSRWSTRQMVVRPIPLAPPSRDRALGCISQQVMHPAQRLLTCGSLPPR